jgi:hypothetical protein
LSDPPTPTLPSEGREMTTISTAAIAGKQ